MVQEKKTLEDHMVSVVVQLVKETKESERHAMAEGFVGILVLEPIGFS